MSGGSSSDHKSATSPWWPVKWGVLGSVLVGTFALYGPAVVMEPLAALAFLFLPFSTNTVSALLNVVALGLMVGVVLAALAFYGKQLRDIGLKKPTLAFMAKGLLGLMVYIVVSFGAQKVAERLFNLNTAEPQQLAYHAPGGAEMAMVFLLLVLLTPFAEELIFRGFMFTGFRRQLPFWVAAVGVSALFGFVHGQWNVGLDVFAMSLVACFLVEKTQSLWPAIFLHMFKNAVAFYLVYLYNGS